MQLEDYTHHHDKNLMTVQENHRECGSLNELESSVAFIYSYWLALILRRCVPHVENAIV